MAITIQSSSLINAPTGVVMTGAGDQFWLLDDVNVVSATLVGVRMTGASAVVTVDGTIQTLLPAIQVEGAGGSVYIGSTGVVRSTGSGAPTINFTTTLGNLVNNGLVESVRDIAIYAPSTNIQSAGIVNNGTINAGMTGVYLATGSTFFGSTLENRGTIVGGNLIGVGQSSLQAGVTVDSGFATVTNHGTISTVAYVGSAIYLTTAGSTFTRIANTGTISANAGIGIQCDFLMTTGGITVVNSGVISAKDSSLALTGSRDVVRNSGLLDGDVYLYGGDDLLVNSGRIDGNVVLWDGNDTYMGRDGTVTGTINAMSGDDTVMAGERGELIYSGTGNDSVEGGGGDDTIQGQEDNDTLRGGDGNDSLLGESGNDSLNGGAGNDWIEGGFGLEWIEGGTGEDSVSGGDAEDLIFGNGDDDVLSGDNASDTVYGGNGDDDVAGNTGDDLLWGDRGDDVVSGGSESDWIDGGAGNDTLYGDDGNDSLLGGAGRDVLYAGTGRDALTGGQDADVFVFLTAADAGLGNRSDRLTDFANGLDKVDLSAIRAGQVFIGDAAFGNIRGQVQYVQATGLLSGDTNGDGAADYSLQLVAGTVLLAGDLIL